MQTAMKCDSRNVANNEKKKKSHHIHIKSYPYLWFLSYVCVAVWPILFQLFTKWKINIKAWEIVLLILFFVLIFFFLLVIYYYPFLCLHHFENVCVTFKPIAQHMPCVSISCLALTTPWKQPKLSILLQNYYYSFQ